MEGKHEKSLFDEEIKIEKAKKQQKKAAKIEEQQQSEKDKQKAQEEKEQLIIQIEKALSEDEKNSLEEEFKTHISKPHLQQLSERPRGKKILRQNFLAKKFLSEDD